MILIQGLVILWGMWGGGGGGQRLHRKVQKEDGEFTEKFVVSIENI